MGESSLNRISNLKSNFSNLDEGQFITQSHDSIVTVHSVEWKTNSTELPWMQFCDLSRTVLQDLSPHSDFHGIETTIKSVERYKEIYKQLSELVIHSFYGVEFVVIPKNAVSIDHDKIGLISPYVPGPRLDQLLDCMFTGILDSLFTELPSEESRYIMGLNFKFNNLVDLDLIVKLFSGYLMQNYDSDIHVDPANIKVRFNLQSLTLCLVITDLQTFIGKGIYSICEL